MEQSIKQQLESGTIRNVQVIPIHVHDPWDLLGQRVKNRLFDEAKTTEPAQRVIKYSRDDSL